MIYYQRVSGSIYYAHLSSPCSWLHYGHFALGHNSYVDLKVVSFCQRSLDSFAYLFESAGLDWIVDRHRLGGQLRLSFRNRKQELSAIHLRQYQVDLTVAAAQ